MGLLTSLYTMSSLAKLTFLETERTESSQNKPRTLCAGHLKALHSYSDFFQICGDGLIPLQITNVSVGVEEPFALTM